jgi:membrane-associated phospholipid phosphatase
MLLADLARPHMTSSPASAAPRRSIWWRIAVWVPPQYIALLVFGLLLLTLRLVYQQPIVRMVYPEPITKHQLSVRYALYLMAIFAGASLLRNIRPLVVGDWRARWGAARQAVQMVRDWLPFIVLVWIYENLHDLTYLIRPTTLDGPLAQIDEWIFGVQPTLWLQRWTHPLLTDYLDLAYMTYFFSAPMLGGWLYFRGRVPQFKEISLGVLIAFYIGFLGYITVPAVGPQYILADQYTVPLTGMVLHWRVHRVVHKLQTFPRDCFPSMHTGISTVVLYFAWRNRDDLPLRWLTLALITILTVSLWFSTVYLRYHWFIDVVAGWIVAAAASAAGVWLVRVWPTRQRAVAGDDAAR